jgi:hypothetical protein
MQTDTEEDRLVKTHMELLKDALIADGWTEEQIAMWERDPDAVEAMLGMD